MLRTRVGCTCARDLVAPLARKAYRPARIVCVCVCGVLHGNRNECECVEGRERELAHRDTVLGSFEHQQMGEGSREKERARVFVERSQKEVEAPWG